jgi:hypothetical protein
LTFEGPRVKALQANAAVIITLNSALIEIVGHSVHISQVSVVWSQVAAPAFFAPKTDTQNLTQIGVVCITSIARYGRTTSHN